jgi:hypothetical protein
LPSAYPGALSLHGKIKPRGEGAILSWHGGSSITDEIIAALSSDPNAALKITVDTAAEFPEGATDQVKRAVSENARSLGLKSADWE